MIGGGILAGGAVSLALMFVALFLMALAVFRYLLGSASRFAEWRPEEFSTPRRLLEIGYLYGTLVMLIGVPLLFVAIGALFILVGLVLFFIGWIGQVIYFFRLRSTFDSAMFLAAGILTILSIFSLGILQFVVWILVFLEAGYLENRVASATIQI